MRKNMKWIVAGSTVLAAATMMTVGAGAVSGQKPVTPLHLSAADSTGNVTSADQAAISYVDANYSGSGSTNVLTTTADSVGGVAVYDVSITAPDGSTYLVQVQQSNDAVLSASLTSSQGTTPPVTTPPVTTPPVLTPVVNVPTVTGESDATETEDGSGSSTSDQSAGVGSEDSSGDSTNSLGVTSSPSSTDGSGDSQGVGTSSQGGSSNSGIVSTMNGDN